MAKKKEMIPYTLVHKNKLKTEKLKREDAPTMHPLIYIIYHTLRATNPNTHPKRCLLLD